MYNDKYLELIIAKNLKDMIENPEVDVDVDRAWKNFEKILKERKKKELRQKIYKLTLVASVILLVAGTFNINKVTAFKTEVQKWISTTDTGDTLITEKINANYEPGEYTGVSFEEAQRMTIFHLKYPRYLPENINNQPIIHVNITDVFPIAMVDLTFSNEDSSLIISQQNQSEMHGRNTYVPNNFTVETISINNSEITIIKGDDIFQALWTNNSNRYTVFSKKISYNEFIKILENLK